MRCHLGLKNIFWCYIREFDITVIVTTEHLYFMTSSIKMLILKYLIFLSVLFMIYLFANDDVLKTSCYIN